jgi:hypothetical protein
MWNRIAVPNSVNASPSWTKPTAGRTLGESGCPDHERARRFAACGLRDIGNETSSDTAALPRQIDKQVLQSKLQRAAVGDLREANEVTSAMTLRRSQPSRPGHDLTGCAAMSRGAPYLRYPAYSPTERTVPWPPASIHT